MTDDVVKAMAQEMSRAVREHVARAVEPLQAKIKALEASQIKYVGLWKEGDCYHERDIVTHSGCLWHCQAPETRDRPGTDAWKLMQKSR